MNLSCYLWAGNRSLLNWINSRRCCKEGRTKMGGSFPKLSYKNLQTIKHALQEYLKRDGITENDMKSEQALLSKINDEIELMRERHRF